MKDLTPKFNDVAGPSGQLTAEEFNDFAGDVQTAITESGQTLTTAVGENNRQLSSAIAVGGRKIPKSNGETADIGDVVQPDNSSGPITINLPNTGLFVNATVKFEPVFGQLYSINSLTLGRNGNKIMNLSEDFVMDSANSNNVAISAIWRGVSFGWEIQVTGVVGRSS